MIEAIDFVANTVVTIMVPILLDGFFSITVICLYSQV